MKLITNSQYLRTTFIHLLKTYREYYFATAWAGIPDEVFDELRTNNSRIKQFAVGIDFQHTHPDFLSEFRSKVVVTQYTEGTYHPKMFLFYNSDEDWTLIIGSANFTKGAFYHNTEAVIEINSKYSNAKKVLSDCRSFINRCVGEGKAMTEGEIDLYRLKWKKARRSRRNEVGVFEQKTEDIWLPTEFMFYNWNEYVAEYEDYKERVIARVKMLGDIKSIFSKKHSLIRMTEHERRLIAGMPNGINENWADFGTNGNGKFMKKMRLGNEIFSRALDQIPLTREVTREQYEAFVEIFLTDEDISVNWISSAGRLLAMKRPDTFYSVTGANRAGFCDDFGIIYSHVTLETYWDLVIQRIILSEWWEADIPDGRFQRNLWENRAAMLDVLYYEGF